MGPGVLHHLKLGGQALRGASLGRWPVRVPTMTVDLSLVLFAAGIAGAVVLAYWLGIEVGKDRGH
jgi:hypothetical protein